MGSPRSSCSCDPHPELSDLNEKLVEKSKINCHFGIIIHWGCTVSKHWTKEHIGVSLTDKFYPSQLGVGRPDCSLRKQKIVLSDIWQLPRFLNSEPNTQCMLWLLHWTGTTVRGWSLLMLWRKEKPRLDLAKLPPSFSHSQQVSRTVREDSPDKLACEDTRLMRSILFCVRTPRSTNVESGATAIYAKN